MRTNLCKSELLVILDSSHRLKLTANPCQTAKFSNIRTSFKLELILKGERQPRSAAQGQEEARLPRHPLRHTERALRVIGQSTSMEHVFKANLNTVAYFGHHLLLLLTNFLLNATKVKCASECCGSFLVVDAKLFCVGPCGPHVP